MNATANISPAIEIPEFSLALFGRDMKASGVLLAKQSAKETQKELIQGIEWPKKNINSSRYVWSPIAVMAAITFSQQANAVPINPIGKYETYLPHGSIAGKSNQPESTERFILPNIDPKSVYVAEETELETEFKSLATQWREETFSYSSLTKMFNHPAYVGIIAMGKKGLPFVLRELRDSNDNWFYALKFMAGKDGAGVADGINDFEAAKAAWLEWGYNKNYI